MTSGYAEAYRASLEDPEGFWLRAAAAIDWDAAPTRALDDSGAPLTRWFPDGRLNTSVNALDRHVAAGAGDRVALIHHSAMTGTVRRLSYAELLRDVERAAGALAELGVTAGDRVLLYLPMIPEAVVAMLACARLGAVHSVVFGGFAARELAARLDDADPVVVVTATGGLEPGRSVPYLPLLETALGMSTASPRAVVVKHRPEVDAAPAPDGWLDWDAVVADAEPHPPVSVAATDPLYILYTSGTTGSPKGVVRDHGGHAVALAWSMRAVYGIGPGDTMFTASDVGWVVGHSYIVYGPLLVGATTVLYEGKPVGTPDAAAFWRVAAEHGASALFTAPTAIRAIRRADPAGEGPGRHDLSRLRALFLAGERLDPDTYDWAHRVLGVPVVDHWWQTETGWPICANPLGLGLLPTRPGSPTHPMPGFALEVLDASGHPVPRGTEGSIALRLPLPPGTLPTLWRRDDDYVRGYLSAFPGYYATGDAGYVDDDGYVFVLGRTDDIINVAGHRLSTGSLEQAIARHPLVAECAVIGVHDALKGEVPRALVVLSAGAEASPALRDEVVALVRDEVGPVAALRDVDVVPALPKTRSGKVLRRTMRQIANGEAEVVPPTIDDVRVLDALRPILRRD